MAAGRVAAGLLRLFEAGLLGGDRVFDVWLVALRAGAMSPACAAEVLGGHSDLWRPRISRALQDPKRAALVCRVRSGEYELTPAGASRADKVVLEFRNVFKHLLRT